jgi:hypothetical protein
MNKNKVSVSYKSDDKAAVYVTVTLPDNRVVQYKKVKGVVVTSKYIHEQQRIRAMKKRKGGGGKKRRY